MPDNSQFHAISPQLLRLLRCPQSGQTLRIEDDHLVSAGGEWHYPLSLEGIPLFAQSGLSSDSAKQREHYDVIADKYVENLGYAHTIEYLAYLDRSLLEVLGERYLGVTAEICCGRGEALRLIGARTSAAVGVDISEKMLASARRELADEKFLLAQGDAVNLPLADNMFDSVVMLGGIHHVNDRARLFAEVHRILKPGGIFYFREPVSDFFFWRWLRAPIYKLSPALDENTERPLLYRETVPPLLDAGFDISYWRTYGFFGFCLFMNSDILVFNRAFRFIPGIRAITRAFCVLDEAITSCPMFRSSGLIVIGAAMKKVNEHTTEVAT